MSNTKTPDGKRTKHGGPADAGLLELEGQIATVPAKGLTGIAAKLRLAMSLFEETHYGSPTEVGCTKTALEAVERLLKGGKNAA